MRPIDANRPAKWRLVKKYKRSWLNPSFVVKNANYKVPNLLVDHADYKCSNCGHIISRPLDMVDPYCGGCGCKMEVEDETD